LSKEHKPRGKEKGNVEGGGTNDGANGRTTEVTNVGKKETTERSIGGGDGTVRGGGRNTETRAQKARC
jgi:hypothetical protein